jgi:chondroitin AC lyase
MNQCWLKGPVSVMESGQKRILPKGEYQLENVNWVLHDSIGYLFLQPEKLNISNKQEMGSWFKINRQTSTSKEEVKGDVFKLWVDHGKRPQNANYQYVVLPAVSENDLVAFTARNPITVLVNTADVQAVKHSLLNITEIVFYKSGEIQITPELKVSMDHPGMVMIKTEGNSVKSISVADPSRKLKRMHLSVNQKLISADKNIKSVYNEPLNLSELTIDLSQENYAGKSTTIDF